MLEVLEFIDHGVKSTSEENEDQKKLLAFDIHDKNSLKET